MNNCPIERTYLKWSAAMACYDPKCAELSRQFLAGEAINSEDAVMALASHIQQSIEDWIAAREIENQ